MTSRFFRPMNDDRDGKRRRLDRNAGRVIEVGIQTVHTVVDRPTIDRILEQYRRGESGLLPTLTLEGFQPLKGEPAFVIRGRAYRDGPRVMTALNGLEIEAGRRYQDPESVRLVVRAMIQSVGTPLENAPQIGSSLKPAVALGVAGLATLAAKDASPGAGAVYDVAPFVDGLMTSSRGGQATGKVTLILRNRDSTQVARRLNKMASMINNDPELWKQAMSSHEEIAFVWQNAVRALVNKSTTDGLLLIFRCLQEGILTVPTASVNGKDVPTELLPDGGGGQLSPEEITARLANFLQLTAPTDSLYGLLPPRAVQKYGMLKHTFSNSVFYTGDSTNGLANARYEFGASKNPVTGAVTFLGRFDNRKVTESRIGSMLSAQLNSFMQAAAAYDTASCDEGRMSAGRFMSGSDARGSNAAMLSYGAHA
jgi:hypothetical protein